MLLSAFAFVFFTLGLKLVLAAAVIYYLLSGDRDCLACGNETLPLVIPVVLRPLARRFGLQRRWCPTCGEAVMARSGAAMPGPDRPCR